MDGDGDMPATPAIQHLRVDAAPMERSLSQDIREEREDLKEAAEQTLNLVMDLDLKGVIKWVSASWKDVVGTEPEDVTGKPIEELLLDEDKEIFKQAVESMQKDDSKSQIIRFTVSLGPASKLLSFDDMESQTETLDSAGAPAENNSYGVVELEAQGIMVYDRSSEEASQESHTMWMIRPWVAPREIKIQMPGILVEGLGSGAEILASYFTALAENGFSGSDQVKPPEPILCRICERQIPAWWFEKHTELCLQEHQAEMEVQMSQERLTDHRHAIVKVLDSLEARKSRPVSTAEMPPPAPQAEYKGLPIGPSSQTSSASGSASPASANRAPRDPSAHQGQGNHRRARSFAVRRPQARIVELLLDLCDTALEISTPAIKESPQQPLGEFRTQSPLSESRVSQVLAWQSPTTNTLDQEQGLAVLCADTEKVAKDKIDAVFRHRKIIEYSERIRIEFHRIVQEYIDEAIRKGERIAAGLDTDSTEGEDDEVAVATEDESMFSGSYDGPSTSTLSQALREEQLKQEHQSGHNSISSKTTSIHGSTHGSNSPRECPTPKSLAGTLNMLTDHRRSSRASTRATSRRGSIYLESGNEDSDAGSFRSSSVMSRSARVDSPMSDFGHLRRQASSRQRNRRSMVLPPAAGAVSPQRQESPSRPASRLSSSPLRISKPRVFTNSTDGVRSPIISPMLGQYEFMSPSNVPHHHRRKSSAANSHFGSGPPPSPRLSSVGVPQARAVPPSIKDFEIIKPISKGAFGSVYLSKKKSTGDYFAIKVLKKADMVAKNQVTNVKAERAIMMWQGESEFVAKLYWTFSSKDYLYLVMEYLNGGDCASLIKVLGGLPEDWSKKYLGEVILGVEHLHSRNIVHRDLKPDNLLIDQKGHLKLTDFGLSRMGLIGRQKRVLANGGEQPPDLLAGNGPFARSSSMGSSRSASFDFNNQHSPGSTPVMTPDLAGGMGQPSYFNLNRENSIGGPPSARHSMRSDSGQSDSLSTMFSNFTINDQADQQRGDLDLLAENHRGSPEMFNLHQTTSHGSTDTRVTPPLNAMMPPPMALFDPDDNTRRFVGTPDYLAPETVKGLGQDETSDWWSVGCILFEFLYGYPPFHGDTPEHVFENILARKIAWPDDDDVEVSAEAKDLMNKLLCMDPSSRLGANSEDKYPSGGAEIRAHPWFADINWDTLLVDEAQFVPAPENLEDTEYFDTRGATLQTFAEEMEDQLSPQVTTAPAEYAERPHDALSRVRAQVNSSTVKRGLMPLHIPPHVRDLKSRRLSEPVVADDFGSFTFKNLPVLEKANKDVIQKLRADALAAQSKSVCVSPVSTTSSSNVVSPEPKLQGSPAMPMSLQRTLSSAKERPASPGAQSHASPSPSRQSQPSSPLLLSFSTRENEARRKAANASGLSQSSSLQPQGFFDAPPKISPSLVKAASVSGTAASSPIKARGSSQLPLTLSPQRSMPISVANVTPGRTRAQTLGSQDGSPIVTGELFTAHKRRSGVFDMSPSSSDNEQEKANALLRVQRRRQSSRRLSHINFSDGPVFRPLDVLICDAAPSYRLMMVKLLEKLRCRTITVADGAEATRVASSDIKFDIIMMEFKLPSVNGADVARMIRNTKNANSTTPIIAITGYIRELQKPHFFDELIEKPPTISKLTDVMCRFCNWKAPSPGWSGALQYPPSGLRLERRFEDLRLDDSPSSTSSTFAQLPGMTSSYRGSSRGDSIGSSLFGDTESAITNDDVPVIISRKATGDWGEDGLGLNEEVLLQAQDKSKPINRLAQPAAPLPSIPHLLHHRSAPPTLPQTIERAKSPSRLRRREAVVGLRDRRLDTAESGDDEDEILGDVAVREKSPKGLGIQHRPRGSKLGTEMMRTNSRGSVVSVGGNEDVMDDDTISNVSPGHTRSDSNISPGDSTGKISPMPSKGALTPPTEHPGEVAEEDDFKTPKPFKSNVLDGGSSKSGTDSEEPTPRPRSSVDYLSAGNPSPRRSGEIDRSSPRRSADIERR